MPDINAAFPSKYLKAHDIGDDDMLVTIASVKNELMKSRDGGEESLPIVYFRETDKGMVLNKTNAKKISTLLKSSDTDDWIDQPIKLYQTETTFGGDTVACIRVKQAALPSKAQSKRPPTGMAPQAVDSDDPF